MTTYPAILTIRKGAAPEGHELRFWKVETLPESNFLTTWETAAGPYTQAALGAGSWELENPSLRALRKKILTGKRTLKKVYGSPLYGIKTGLNAAFIINTPTKERLCAEDPRSAEILKPLLEGKDLKRWRAEPRGLWLIYIPKNRIDIDDYPAIRDWLLPFKDNLEKRATKQEWYELQQAQEGYAPHFEKTKITYRDIAAHSPFHLDISGSYLETTAFAIPSDDYAVVALLNSKVLWFVFKSLTPLARGDYYRMKAQYVGLLPIPELNSDNQETLARLSQKAQFAAEARLNLQDTLTRRIPDLCPPDRTPKLTTKLQEWWTSPSFAAFRTEVKKAFKVEIPLAERSAWEDWITRDRAEIIRLSAEITKAETEIDQTVYELFELNLDEIALLEAVIGN